jgi:hypothetical protein
MKRFGKFKGLTDKWNVLSTMDGGSINGPVSVEGATTFSSTLGVTGDITATGGIKGASVARQGTDGLAGTGTAPTVSILTTQDEIITTVKIDLTGLGQSNDVGDVIGRTGVNNAYMFTYAAATHGVFHKIEISCVELPTSASNNLLDFDIISCDETTLTLNGDAAGATNPVALTAMAGNIALGQTYQDLTAGQPNADGDAIYLTEGAASGGADTFTAGMLVIKFYGSKTF